MRKHRAEAMPLRTQTYGFDRQKQSNFSLATGGLGCVHEARVGVSSPVAAVSVIAGTCGDFKTLQLPGKKFWTADDEKWSERFYQSQKAGVAMLAGTASRTLSELSQQGLISRPSTASRVERIIRGGVMNLHIDILPATCAVFTVR